MAEVDPYLCRVRRRGADDVAQPGRDRAVARRLVFAAAATIFGGPRRFIRGPYAHALFPEQREKFRGVIRWLKNRGDFIDTHSLGEKG